MADRWAEPIGAVGPRRTKMALAAALVGLLLGGAAEARPFWEDDSFVSDLGLPNGGGGLRGTAPFRRPNRFEEDLPEAKRLGEGLPDAPPLEPSMSYGDAGSFARFREQLEQPDTLRREAVEEGPFGGQSRSAPVEHRVAGAASRFESPSFAEVFSQLKEIVADPRGVQAVQKAQGQHLSASVTGVPEKQPPLAPPPPQGVNAGPPIPMPPPVLTPIDDKPKEAPVTHNDDHKLSRAVFGQRFRFKMELDDSARLQLAHPGARGGSSLVETEARAEETEAPEVVVHRLLTGEKKEQPPVKLPAFVPMAAEESIIGNPYVRFD